MNADKLEKILEDHQKWLNNEGGERANLSWSNLRNADLRGVNLTNANLSRANLTGAKLIGVNLTCANLTNANLINADLSRIDLTGADLRNAKFAEIKTDTRTIQIHAATVRIGYRNHTHEEWMSFTDEEIAAMDDLELSWWKAWKPSIETAIKNVRAQNEQGSVASNP